MSASVDTLENWPTTRIAGDADSSVTGIGQKGGRKADRDPARKETFGWKTRKRIRRRDEREEEERGKKNCITVVSKGIR